MPVQRQRRLKPTIVLRLQRGAWGGNGPAVSFPRDDASRSRPRAVREPPAAGGLLPLAARPVTIPHTHYLAGFYNQNTPCWPPCFCGRQNRSCCPRWRARLRLGLVMAAQQPHVAGMGRCLPAGCRVGASLACSTSLQWRAARAAWARALRQVCSWVWLVWHGMAWRGVAGAPWTAPAQHGQQIGWHGAVHNSSRTTTADLT